MHAIKSGWAGQTFALAKRHESEGRKARVRRSKEERKDMVESFIKKYQKLNDGKFPSLNLTHKECGGSFYTIREIVREIIQENRVLGPAKLTSKEQDDDQLLEQFPVGTIATGPQPSSFLSPNENKSVLNHNRVTSAEVVLNSDGLYVGLANLTSQEQDTDQFLEQYPSGTIPIVPQRHLSLSSNEYHPLSNHTQGSSEEPVLNSDVIGLEAEPQELEGEKEVNGSLVDVKTTQGSSEEPVLNSDVIGLEAEPQRLESKKEVNGSLVDVNIEESSKINLAEFQASNQTEGEKSVKDLVESKAKVTDITIDVTVETFPIRPVTKLTNGLSVRSGELGELTRDEKEIEKLDLGPKNGSSLVYGVDSAGHSDLVNQVEITARRLVERENTLVDTRAVENLADSTLESSDCINIKEGVAHDKVNLEQSYNGVLTSDTFEQSKAMNAPNGIKSKSLGGISTGSSVRESATQVATVVETKTNVKQSSSTQKESNPTLDRINLQSWEGTSKRTTEPESNPLLAIFKSFIAAFVRFWSE